MAYNLIGEVAHECFGVAMIVMFLCHHLLNRNWYKTLIEGKYSKIKTFCVMAYGAYAFVYLLGKNKFLCYNSVDDLALTGMDFCQSKQETKEGFS